MAELARSAKGKITFWGEIDRQSVLPSPDPEDARRAVREVARHLYDPAGGIVAQFEFGAGANPETALAVFDEWDRVQAEALRAIGICGDENQLDFLRQAAEMDSPRDVIRSAAAWAIEEISRRE